MHKILQWQTAVALLLTIGSCLCADIKCEVQGFYRDPEDCNKYYWCQSSGPKELSVKSSVVTQEYTCLPGLQFNLVTNTCDYPANVYCQIGEKKTATTEAPVIETTTPSTTTARPIRTTRKRKNTISRRRIRVTTTPTTTTTSTTSTTTTTTSTTESPESEEDPEIVQDLLDLIEKAGGIYEVQKLLDLQKETFFKKSQSEVHTEAPTTKQPITFKSRSQHTTKRSRISALKPVEKPDDNKERRTLVTTSRPNQLDYVTIRRSRGTTTTAASADADYDENRR